MTAPRSFCLLHPTRLPLLRVDAVYLEAREIAFEEHDISADLEARRAMTGTIRQRRNAHLGDSSSATLQKSLSALIPYVLTSCLIRPHHRIR